MKRCRVLLALVFLFSVALAKSNAATIEVHIDGASATVPNYEIPAGQPDAGKFVIGTPQEEGFSFATANGEINLNGMLDPDPSILFGGGVIDVGAASSFGITIILPLVPVVSNPSIVFDSVGFGVVNGSAAGGVTVTALAPPAGVPDDGDRITDIQVFTLSDDGGATWKNVGLDAGPTTFVPLAAFAAGPMSFFNQGPIPTIAGGPWTHMRADLSFMLSGGGDALVFSGAKVLVPEPGTLPLVVLALGAALGLRRRA
jgi:hypothetical protein